MSPHNSQKIFDSICNLWNNPRGHLLAAARDGQVPVKKIPESHKVTKIIEEGFRFEDELPSDSFPNGVSYIYRNIDNELIGRTEFVPEENAWNSRYYMFGGGTTFGGFTTKWMAAQWALLENAKLHEGWNE